MATRSLNVQVRGTAKSFTTTLQNAKQQLAQFERRVLTSNATMAASMQGTGASARSISAGYAAAAAGVRRAGTGIARTTKDINNQLGGVVTTTNRIGKTSHRTSQNLTGVGLAAGTMAARTSAGLGQVNRGLATTAKHAGAMHGEFENYAGFVGFQMLGRSAIVMGGMIAAGFGLSVKAFADFEDSFALVRKTLDASEGQFQQISSELRELATTVPLAVTELNEVAGVAGQLGVPAEHITKFTEVMAELGVATDLTAEQAAMSMARIAAVMQESLGDEGVGRMSSTLVDLGNNFAATESEISRFTERIASTGAVVGMASADMFAFSTAFTAVGVKAERGGTAFQRVVFDMMDMVEAGGHELEILAGVAGVTAEEFAASWRADPSMALVEFIEGLDRAGTSASSIMTELFGKNVRITQSFMAVASAGDLVRRALARGRDAFEENNARAEEAATRFGTLTNRLKTLGNRIKEVAIGIGEQLAPVVEGVASAAVAAFEVFGRLPEPLRDILMVLGAVGAAALIVGGSMALMVFPMRVLQGILPQLSAQWAVATGVAESTSVAMARQAINTHGLTGATIELTAAEARLLAIQPAKLGLMAKTGNVAMTAAAGIRAAAVAAAGFAVMLVKVAAPIALLYGAYKALSWAHSNLEEDFIDVSSSAKTAAESIGIMVDKHGAAVDKLSTTGAVAKFRVDNKELLDSFAHMEEWQREHALIQIAFDLQQRGATAEEIQQTVEAIQTASPYNIDFDVSVGDLDNPTAYFNSLGEAAEKAFESLSMKGLLESGHQYRQQLDEIGKSLGMLFESGEMSDFRAEWAMLLNTMGSGQDLIGNLMHMRGGIEGMFEAMGLAKDEAQSFAATFSSTVTGAINTGSSEAEALELAFKTLAKQAADNGMVGLAADLLRASGATDHTTERTLAAYDAQVAAASATDDAGDAALTAAGKLGLMGDEWEEVRDGAETARDAIVAAYATMRGGIGDLTAAGRAISELERAQYAQVKASMDVRDAERTLESARVSAARLTEDIASAEQDLADAYNGTAADADKIVDAQRRLEDLRVDAARLPEDIAAAERDLAEAYRGTAADADRIVDAERRVEDMRISAKRLPQDVAMAERDLARARADSDPEGIIRAERRLEDLRLEASRAPEDLERAERHLNEERQGSKGDTDAIEQAERRLEDLRREARRMPEDLARAERSLNEERSGGGADADTIREAERRLQDLRAEQAGMADTIAAAEQGVRDARLTSTDVIWDQIEANEQYNERMLTLLGTMADLGIESGTLDQIQAELKEAFGLTDEEASAVGDTMVGVLEKAMEAGEKFDALGGNTDVLGGALRALGTDSDLMMRLLGDNVEEGKIRLAGILEAMNVSSEEAMGAAETIFDEGGADAAAALIAALATGGGDVAGVLQGYIDVILESINPVLKGLDKKEIEGLPGGVRFKPKGSRLTIFEEGGIDKLPGQAKIQSPQPNLVQWAEPGTQGEAFIPLARSKRNRSLKIWQKTGELLGADTESYLEGDLRGIDNRFLDQFKMWSQSEGPFRVVSGWRSSAKQAELYRRYLAGVGNLAAPPGHSQHEKGLAIDHSPNSWGIAATAGPFGITHPVKSESWHAEPVWGRGAGAGDGSKYQGLIGRPELPPVPDFPHNGFFQSGPRIAEAMRAKALAFMQENMFASLDPLNVQSTPGAEGLKQMAQEMLASRGWSQFWPALDALITKESSWNPNAQNPTSTAYGLGQFLDSTWAGVGATKTSDPAAQLAAMLRYISDRYGDPAAALRFHLANNWYEEGGFNGVQQFDSGGLLQPGTTLAVNRTGSPEPVSRFAEGGIRFGTTKNPIGGPNFNTLNLVVQSLLSAGQGANGLAEAIKNATAALEQWERQIDEAEFAERRAEAQRKIKQTTDDAKAFRGNPEAFKAAKEKQAEAIRELQILDAQRERDNERRAAQDRIRRAEEEAAIRREIELNIESMNFDKMSRDEQIANLEARMNQHRTFTNEWKQLNDERRALIQQMVDEQLERKANQESLEFDNMATAQKIANIDARLAAEIRYSQAWMTLFEQRRALVESELDTLNNLLDEEESIREQMAQLGQDAYGEMLRASENHKKNIQDANKRRQEAEEEAEKDKNDRLLDLTKQFDKDRQAIIDRRAEELFSSFDPFNRIEREWPNRMQAVTRNIAEQLASGEAWQSGLNQLRAMGMSEEAIQALDLDQMTAQSLATVQLWSNATEEEVATLNAQIAAMQEFAAQHAEQEAANQHGATGAALIALSEDVAAQTAQIHADHAATLAEIVQTQNDSITESHAALEETLAEISESTQAEMQTLRDELEAIGTDQGRTVSEAIAAGMASGIPAIRAQAEAIRRIMEGAGGTGAINNDTQESTPGIEGDSGPIDTNLPLPSHLQGATTYRTADGNVYLKLKDGSWWRATGPGQRTAAEQIYGTGTNVPPSHIGQIQGSILSLFGSGGAMEQYIPQSYDSGGILPPGLTMAYNGTRQAEYVLQRNSRQNQGFSNGPQEITVVVENHLDGKKISEDVTKHQIQEDGMIRIRRGHAAGNRG